MNQNSIGARARAVALVLVHTIDPNSRQWWCKSRTRAEGDGLLAVDCGALARVERM
jgi:hypothetical protein